MNTDKRPSVLIIDNSTYVTGALKSIVRTAIDLQNDFSFHFILPNKSKGRSFIEQAGFYSIYEIPMYELSRRPFSWIYYCPMLLFNAIKVKRIIKEQTISLIHNNDLYNLIPVILKLIGIKMPYLCHIRFLPEKFPKLLFFTWFRVHSVFAWRIIAVSHFLSNLLPQSKKVIVIHDQLPIGEKYPNFQGGENEYIKLLYVANFIRGKGHEYALRAFLKLHNLYPNCRLRFVGGDMGLSKNREFRNELQQFCKINLLESKVEWAEFTENVEAEYKQADIVLNFSESESFSMTCLEALFFGRALIATDCGGPSELIESGKTGFLVPKYDINAMTTIMEKLILDSDLRSSLGKNARINVRKKFDIHKTSHLIRNCYKELLSIK